MQENFKSNTDNFGISIIFEIALKIIFLAIKYRMIFLKQRKHPKPVRLRNLLHYEVLNFAF